MIDPTKPHENLILGDEVNVLDIAYLLWDKKLFITSFTSIAAIISVLYALYLPSIYTSTALLAPSNNQESGMGGGLGQYAGVASLAGISLPGSSGEKSVEAVQRIQSFEFFEKYLLPTISLQNLMAIDKWHPATNTISYLEEDFDIESQQWVRPAIYPLSSKPSSQEAYRVFSKLLSIDEDKLTGFINISIEHQSPYIAQKWVQQIITQINESMREIEKAETTKSVDFLNRQIANIFYEEVRQAISALIQQQVKNLMVIESNEYYVLKILDSPIVPERRSAPVRSLIAILGTLFGIVFSTVTVIIMNYLKVTPLKRT
jgi:LPS O-antigen subunit length determinant protein (WzzB/FepE family)|tara:strand:- start:8 stop:958 length:951 start_codon:yes stop_codon:yes gene_type:complete